MTVWNLHLHLGPQRAPVDQRPQLETGLRGYQCFMRWAVRPRWSLLLWPKCLSVFVVWTCIRLHSSVTLKARDQLLPSLQCCLKCRGIFIFFWPWNTLQRALAVPPDRLQRSCLHSTEFEVCESLCERLFVCSQVILQDAGKEVTSDENVSQSRDTKHNAFGHFFLSVWLFKINVLYPPYFSCKSGRGHL